MTNLKLYTYFRSSAAYRVRIALHLKGVEAEAIPINLLKGEQLLAGYKTTNPQGLVPALEVGDALLTQSLAILEYLEETHPTPPLLPKAPLERARVRSLALLVACEMHPINNLRVLKYLTGAMGQSEETKNIWYHHWIAEGFTPLEQMLAESPETGGFCHGQNPTLADICLVPQVANALRFNCDLAPYPTIRRIYENCLRHPAFLKARPENQPDCPQELRTA